MIEGRCVCLCWLWIHAISRCHWWSSFRRVTLWCHWCRIGCGLNWTVYTPRWCYLWGDRCLQYSWPFPSWIYWSMLRLVLCRYYNWSRVWWSCIHWWLAFGRSWWYKYRSVRSGRAECPFTGSRRLVHRRFPSWCFNTCRCSNTFWCFAAWWGIFPRRSAPRWCILLVWRCILSVCRCILSIRRCILLVWRCILSVCRCILSIRRRILLVWRCILSVYRCILSIFRCIMSHWHYHRDHRCWRPLCILVWRSICLQRKQKGCELLYTIDFRMCFGKSVQDKNWVPLEYW